MYSKIIKDSRELYSKAVREYSAINEQAVRYPKLECRKDSGEVEEAVHLILDFLERYDILHRQNSEVRNFSKSFVSNAIKVKG